MFNLNPPVFTKYIMTHKVQTEGVELILLPFLRNLYAINIFCLQVE